MDTAQVHKDPLPIVPVLVLPCLNPEGRKYTFKHTKRRKHGQSWRFFQQTSLLPVGFLRKPLTVCFYHEEEHDAANIDVRGLP